MDVDRAAGWAAIAAMCVSLAACGGGGGEADGGGPAPAPAPAPAPSPAPVAPTIGQAPQAVQATVGQTTTFSVVAAGTAPLAYQWLRDGGNIAGATAAQYTTPALTLADSGAQFAVRVTNAAGSVVSAAAALTVVAAIAQLPAGTTDRNLAPLSPFFADAVQASMPASARWLMDPASGASTGYTPAPVNGSLGRLVLGGEVDAQGGIVRRYGARHLFYNPGAKDLYRLTLDRAGALPTAATQVGTALVTCDLGYRFVGSSSSGNQVVYAWIERPVCGDGTYHVADVGPAGDGQALALPGAPLSATFDDQGRIDGYLAWSGDGALVHVAAGSGVVTQVPPASGTPANNGGVFGTPGNGPQALRTRGGVLFQDQNRVVWRYDHASKTLSAPLWRQSSNIGSPASRVAVDADAVTVADVECHADPANAANSICAQPTVWRVEDTRAAAVTVLAQGNGLDLNSVRYARDHVLLTDDRAQHVAIAKRDGQVAWSGPNQIGPDRAEQTWATLLSNTLFFSGTPLGGQPRLLALNLDDGSTRTLDGVQAAGSALSDEVPLYASVVQRSHGLALSHLLAWRPVAGRADLGLAELVWVDMASAAVVAVSGRLPDAAYASAGIDQLFVAGHIGLGSAWPSSGAPSLQEIRFSFGIGAGSLRLFTPPH